MEMVMKLQMMIVKLRSIMLVGLEIICQKKLNIINKKIHNRKYQNNQLDSWSLQKVIKKTSMCLFLQENQKNPKLTDHAHFKEYNHLHHHLSLSDKTLTSIKISILVPLKTEIEW